jgi:hypothetical protein
LRDEGYDIVVKSGYLLVRDVPYVTADRKVKRGTLVSNLSLAGEVTARPNPHVAYFMGEYPCNADGGPIEQMRLGSQRQDLVANEVIVDHSFSSKPPCGFYADYYEKMTTYVAILVTQAQALDPTATARTFPAIPDDGEDSVFRYTDTASSRADIVLVTSKLAVGKVAIVGLGGTGAYVLDLVAKTPVKEIHVFDGDSFSQHNAFRSPGAASIEDLRAKPSKVAYFNAVYSRMHRGMVPHESFVDASNLMLLDDMTFVFICVDDGPAKKVIVERLLDRSIPFVDVGMGVDMRDGNMLAGILRVTTSTTRKNNHVYDRISFASEGNGLNVYAKNIQIADLNALNAALAVVKWKKLFGFYADLADEHHSAYTIDGNHLTNEDYSEATNSVAI